MFIFCNLPPPSPQQYLLCVGGDARSEDRPGEICCLIVAGSSARPVQGSFPRPTPHNVFAACCARRRSPLIVHLASGGIIRVVDVPDPFVNVPRHIVSPHPTLVNRV